MNVMLNKYEKAVLAAGVRCDELYAMYEMTELKYEQDRREAQLHVIKEGGTIDDLGYLYTEAFNDKKKKSDNLLAKIGSAVAAFIDKIIEFIKKCFSKLGELFTRKKVKKAPVPKVFDAIIKAVKAIPGALNTVLQKIIHGATLTKAIAGIGVFSVIGLTVGKHNTYVDKETGKDVVKVRRKDFKKQKGAYDLALSAVKQDSNLKPISYIGEVKQIFNTVLEKIKSLPEKAKSLAAKIKDKLPKKQKGTTNEAAEDESVDRVSELTKFINFCKTVAANIKEIASSFVSKVSSAVSKLLHRGSDVESDYLKSLRLGSVAGESFDDWSDFDDSFDSFTESNDYDDLLTAEDYALFGESYDNDDDDDYDDVFGESYDDIDSLLLDL